MTTMSALDTKAEVESVLAALVASWNRHNMTALASYFTDDADFVNVVGVRLRGRQEIKESHIALHQTIFRYSVLRLLGSTVRFVREDVAVAHMQWEMEGADALPGWDVPKTRRGVFSYTLVQDRDRWLVTSAHNTDTVPLPRREDEF